MELFMAFSPLRRARFLGSLALIAFLVMVVWLGYQAPFKSLFTETVVLSGTTPAIVSQSKVVRPADPALKMKIALALRLQDEAVLDELIEDQQNPNSAEYQKFLTPVQFAERFAPQAASLDKVATFLNHAGFTMVEVTANHLVVQAEGTVAQVEAALGVRINEYVEFDQGAGALPRQYLSSDRDPSLPKDIAEIVQAVFGLDTYARLERRMQKADGDLPVLGVGPAPAPPPTPVVLPPAVEDQAPLTPQDIATNYDFPNGNNRKAIRQYNGHGVKVAIATAFNYDKKDIEAYWSKHGIARTGQLIDVPHGGLSAKLEEETTLDLELLSSQLPGADIYMYMSYDTKIIDFFLTFNQVAVDNFVSVMSISWGLCERKTGPLLMKAETSVFKEAAAQGIAIFVASGDDGAYDCKDKKQLLWEVDFPGSSPFVTAVGGTALVVEDGLRKEEEAWKGSGGGYSIIWHQPSWQSGPKVPKRDTRVSADVSLDASPKTGYSFYFQGKWSKIGGTSASAPEWASLWAMAVQACGKRVGFANPYLYRAGRSSRYSELFMDITKGANGAGRGTGYPADKDWDYPTGWGVPRGDALVHWLVDETFRNTF
jgi:kumamolisin